MSRAYYNENDPFAANWLRNLIAAGLIMDGDVDTRSIVDVQGSDVRGYERCHFFAGIGGWDYALQLAGWTGPVWTGSCPCQPFSSAGKGKGTADERHLWPEFARLIRECRPAKVFIEQVASKAGLKWLDGVFADLEREGYACGAADLCAACVGEEAEVEIINEFTGEVVYRGEGVVGPPHIRQRLFGLADAEGRKRRLSVREKQGKALELIGGGEVYCGMGNPQHPRLEGHGGFEPVGDTTRWQGPQRHSTASSSWSNFDIIRCLEPTKEPGRYVEKWRRVESGLVPLVTRLSGRVVVSRTGIKACAEIQEETREVSAAGLIKGYGNAIVPQLAAEFINATRSNTND